MTDYFADPKSVTREDLASWDISGLRPPGFHGESMEDGDLVIVGCYNFFKPYDEFGFPCIEWRVRKKDQERAKLRERHWHL